MGLEATVTITLKDKLGGNLTRDDFATLNLNMYGPQDIRNCVKCHSSETTGTWKFEPSRVACLSCHDSDSSKAHGALMTKDPTPADPYGQDGVETCKTCHGAGKEFAPDKVHNISNPYKPPYPRVPKR